MSPLHRSRIRRRSTNEDGPAVSQQLVGGGGIRSAAAAIATLLLLLPPSTLAYMGPTHCTKRKPGITAVMQSSSVGYSTFNHLLFDMVSVSKSFESGLAIPEERLTFKICAGRTMDLDGSSLPLGFLPIRVPRLTLQCGDRGRRGSVSAGTACVFRGGGKRDPNSAEWNTYPQKSYKNNAAGILGGGGVAQIYVYGESAYEVTLRGLTFDNSVSGREGQMYDDFVARFGEEALGRDDADFAVNGSSGSGVGGKKETIEEEYDASVPNQGSTANNDWGGADRLKNEQGDFDNRELQEGGAADENIKPAHRFASVAVRGKGYGDDAGPRLITIEDCRFNSHRGYAILVSPGIQEPNLPVAPKFEFPQSVPQPPSGAGDGAGLVNNQSSGQVYNAGNINNIGGQNNVNGNKIENDATGDGPSSMMPNGGQDGRQRQLNLLENGGKYIPKSGSFSYYDHAAGKNNYLDGRRVKIVGTEFVDNVVAGSNVAGLVTSAYSLTMTDCFFQGNDAKAMVFVYNDEAIVDNTIFAENKVEVSTVIMASPKGSVGSDGGDDADPTHIVERTCFLGSHVGMSNVLVTDVEKAKFGQRDNHARATKFTWVSQCEGGAAEQFGNDCLETGSCDGTCVQFTSEKCLADRINSGEFENFFSAGNRNVRTMWGLGMTSALALILGACILL